MKTLKELLQKHNIPAEIIEELGAKGDNGAKSENGSKTRVRAQSPLQAPDEVGCSHSLPNLQISTPSSVAQNKL